VALFAAEAGVALERIAHQTHDRERRALELNDEIVQGLVVAKYALRNGRVEMGEKAVDETLDRARALVESQLQELHGAEPPEPGTLRTEGHGIG
jgi:signal transduction histidine kinase